MFESIKKRKGIIITLFLLAGGYYAYATYGSPNLPEGLLSSQSASVDGTEAGQEIIRILEDIKSIHLDVGIFEDEKFNSLIDITEEVKSEAQGRNNPFEAIGFGSDIEGRIAEPSDLGEEITIENNIDNEQ